MARGRFISNAIMSDKKINDLSDDTSRLAFTWLITTADAEGRTHGDPAMVRALLFPRRTDVTVEQIEAYITEWHRAGLIRWYRCNGDLWIDFPNFEKYQVGLRKEREPESQIPPASDGELLPIPDESDGNNPAYFRQTSGTNKAKLNKDQAKLREANSADEPRDPLTETQQRVLSSFNAKRFRNDIQRDAILAWSSYPPENVEAAIVWAATKGFALGQAIENITRALPNWGKPKKNGQVGNDTPMQAAIKISKERHANGNA